MIEKIIKSFLITGIVIYGIAFVYSFSSPQSIERHARSFVKEKVLQKTHDTIDKLRDNEKNSKFVKVSKKLFHYKSQDLARYKKFLKSHIDEKLANVMAKMLNLNAKCRQKYKTIFHGFLIKKITNLKTATKTLEAFMTHHYMFVVSKIIKDFRIFLGSNLLILILMLFVLYQRSQASRKIYFLSGAMFITTVFASYLYLFNQNWFYTIIYNDFIGYTYLLLLMISLFFLVDIIFNKGRVSSALLSGISAPGTGC